MSTYESDFYPPSLKVSVTDEAPLTFSVSPSGDLVVVSLHHNVELKGNTQSVLDVLNLLGYSINSLDSYYSESKGKRMLVAMMDSAHIRAAILKILRSYLEKLKAHEMTNNELLFALDTITDTPCAKLPALVKELRNRGND
jgi:hypothetical protein